MRPSTSVAIIDTESHALAERALRRTLDSFPADEALIFTDRAEPWGGRPIVQIDRIQSLTDYNRIIFEMLPAKVKTDFVLVIQFDGFAINARKFTEDFFDYDYIGAPWAAGLVPDHGATVGNGGFSLRSRRLLQVLSTAPYPIDLTLPEDNLICLTLRERLERGGIRFAPLDVARRFSVESDRTERVTPFGFHGLHLLPLVFGEDQDFLIANLPERCFREGSYQLNNLRLGFANAPDSVKASFEARVRQSQEQTL